MTALDDIYSQKIMELAANISRNARLVAPDATASAHSKLCGSTIIVDLKVEGGEIVDFCQSVKACLLGQAAASVVGREIVGTTPDDMRAIGRTMRAMLTADGPPPTGKWADLAYLEPVKDYRARHASTLLVFDAVERALAQLEGAQLEGAHVASRSVVAVS